MYRTEPAPLLLKWEGGGGGGSGGGGGGGETNSIKAMTLQRCAGLVRAVGGRWVGAWSKGGLTADT